MKRKLIGMILAAGAMLGAWAANVRLYVSAPSAVAWGDNWYCYAWDDGELLGGWPGTKTVKTETRDGVTWHYWDVTVNSDFCLILNDGSGKQTGDFAVTGVSDGKAYFIEVAKSGGNHSCQIVNVGVVASTHNKVQLWENGPYWAETNIGAEEPWDSGYYFWWGDTVGCYRENDVWVASDGSSSNFSFVGANAPTYGKDTATLQSEGWITADGVLAPEHDAAHVQWGDKWRMPTYQELGDLTNKCDWIWTTTNGVNGYIVRGKGDYASASIFLPAAGLCYSTSLHNAGQLGAYWSSVPTSNSNYAYVLYFGGSSHYTDSTERYSGQSIRPVQTAEPTTVGSWTSGDCTVTFDEATGTLTVSGTGAMANYDSEVENSPWYGKRNDVKKVIVQSGVTKIGDEAFSESTNLTSVAISEGVATIGRAAFYGCTSLAEIVFPDGVTTIEGYVFSSCSALTNVYCHMNAADLTWSYTQYDFPSGNSTKIHVKASQLAAYQEKFPNINATFVGDLSELQTLTVHDGTDMSGYVPVYGYYYDAYIRSQTVYPASELSAMDGQMIIGLKWHAVEDPSGSWGKPAVIYLKEVGYTDIDSFESVDDCTVVYEGEIAIVDKVLSVTFATPFTYHGGNLLIGVQNVEPGNYKSASFYGDNVIGASVQGYNYDTPSGIIPTQRNFIPKTTFDYVTSNVNQDSVVPDVSITAGEYFKATLSELGYEVPTNGTPYNVTAYGLPAGLKLKSNPAVTKKVKKGKKTTTVVVTPAKTEWWIEGVPTAALDYATNPPYLVITTNGVAQTLPLSLGVEAQDVMELDDLALGDQLNEQFYLPGVTNGWTVSGLPTGLKYTPKLVTTTKKKGKKIISVTTNALPYSVYGKTTKAGLFTVTAKKKAGAFYETKKYRVLVTPGKVDTDRFGEDLTNITTMAYVPVEWDLTGGGRLGEAALPVVPTVAKVAGLPKGVAFASANVYSDKKKTKLKQYGQTIVGTPTKPGTYVVTFTKNETTGTGKKKKTVAKTAQIFWTVTENDAELSLGFNEKGGVIESGTVGLSYGDLMAFGATSNATVKASGLPKGIALANLGDGQYAFTGFTAKAGTYLVTVTATLNGKTVRQRVALKVDGLPSWAKGTYNGASMFAGSGMKYSGLATVTVSAAGKISGKYQANGTNWTFSASSYDLYDDEKGLYYCTNIVAKYAYKVTEKVKGKKKIVTRYLERNILFLTRNWEVSPGVSFGVAMAGEGDDAIYAYQNVWGRSDYKTLGKKLFYTSKKKPYNIWNDVDAKGLTDAMSLSVKVTSAGAVTATMTFDTGKTTTNKKTKKKTKVYYTATCTTVLIPVSAAGADPFDAMALLYFAPSAANNFPGFCAELHHPFSKRIAPQPGFANSWFTGEFTGYGDAQFPIPDTENYDILNGLFSINVAANLSFTGKFTATDGTTASFSGTFVKDGDMYAASGVAITVRGQTMTMRLGCAAQPYADKDAGFGEMWGGSDAEPGEPCIALNCLWQNIWKRSDLSAEWKPAFASGTEKTLDMSEIWLDGKVDSDTLTYAFGADGAVAVSGQIYGESVSATATLDLEGYDDGTNTMYCNFYFLANGHMYQQQLTFQRQASIASSGITLASFQRVD